MRAPSVRSQDTENEKLMKSDELRNLQAPWKEKFRSDPQSAIATISTKGTVDFDAIACQIDDEADAPTVAGLHPMAGGDGSFACAAEKLLEALVGCAGVTLAAVCTAMEISIDSAILAAEGDMDFRGTLGIDRTTPVGFTEVRLQFQFRSPEPDEKLAKAVQLAERYCVVAQTVKNVSVNWTRVE